MHACFIPSPRPRSLLTIMYKKCCCPSSRKQQQQQRGSHSAWDDDVPMPPHEDVRSLFSLHADGAAQMDEHGLRAAGVETNYKHPLIGHSLFTLDDFHRILFSTEINPPIPQHVHHDMGLPLSHYFIYTAHDSPYHTRPDDQRRGGRCVDAVVRALKMGVRAIDIAMWPNSKKDDINILHGWTQNTPVLLTECLESIKKYAFSASPYPVIITLQDNLGSSKLQEKAAKVLKDVLGNMLYLPTNDHVQVSRSSLEIDVDVGGSTRCDNPLQDFASPKELEGRVLLSTKPPNHIKKGKRRKPRDVGGYRADDDKDDDENDAAWRPEHSVDNVTDNEKDQNVQPHEYPQYQHLIAIKAWHEDCPDDEVRQLSWSKQQIEKVANDLGPNIVRFTQRDILRIYPTGSLLTSSNYNPFLGWVHGAQMVALNMQGYGRALWLMHGFFRANGGCGYVRKPDFLMQIFPEVFDPRKRQPLKKTLKVKVYMGDGWRMDSKHEQISIPDIWTRIGIAGVPADSVMKTRKVTELEFCFPLSVPELALLRVEVHQYDKAEKDVFGGQTVLPVSELRRGIRAVSLFDHQGNQLGNVKLLMRFEFI